MPQDDLEEVRAALLGARHANENPVFYGMRIFIQCCCFYISMPPSILCV